MPCWFKSHFFNCSGLVVCADDSTVVREGVDWLGKLGGVGESRLLPSYMRHFQKCSAGHYYVECHEHVEGHSGSAGHDRHCPVRGCPDNNRSDGTDVGSDLVGTVEPDTVLYVDRIGVLIIRILLLGVLYNPKPSTLNPKP